MFRSLLAPAAYCRYEVRNLLLVTRSLLGGMMAYNLMCCIRDARLYPHTRGSSGHRIKCAFLSSLDLGATSLLRDMPVVTAFSRHTAYGPHARSEAMVAREVVLHIQVHHSDATALGLFAREVAPAATAMAPGTS
jgi:hypothetical protein